VGTKGNAGQQSTRRTQCRISVSQALERIRKFAVTHPRWEPRARKPHVRICAGANVANDPKWKSVRIYYLQSRNSREGV